MTQQYFSAYYPATVEPFTAYVLRNGETYQTFCDRMLISANGSIPWLPVEGVQFDYTDPLFKQLDKGHPLVTNDYGLQVIRSGVLPELDPLTVMKYQVKAYPSQSMSTRSVSLCGDSDPF